jgi:hypothetical protein
MVSKENQASKTQRLTVPTGLLHLRFGNRLGGGESVVGLAQLRAPSRCSSVRRAHVYALL